MRRPRRIGGRAGERGQSLVEFSLVFPIIVFLLIAAFDIGRAVYAYNTIANAARQGARVAAVNQIAPSSSITSCQENMPVEDVVNPTWSPKACAAAAAATLGVGTGNVTVAYGTPSGSTLDCSTALHVGCVATVTVAYSWSAITPLVGSVIGPIAMTSTSQMPIERVFP